MESIKKIRYTQSNFIKLAKSNDCVMFILFSTAALVIPAGRTRVPVFTAAELVCSLFKIYIFKRDAPVLLNGGPKAGQRCGICKTLVEQERCHKGWKTKQLHNIGVGKFSSFRCNIFSPAFLSSRVVVSICQDCTHKIRKFLKLHCMAF